MKDNIKNLLVGIVEAEFGAFEVSTFIVDSWVLGKKEFDYEEFNKFFDSKVLLEKNHEGDKVSRYTPMMESAMKEVLHRNIMPVVRDKFKEGLELLNDKELGGMYEPFHHIASFSSWHEALQEHLVNYLDIEWGYDFDCECCKKHEDA